MSTQTTTEANVRIARRIPEEIATARNLDAVAEVFAEDAVEHGLFGRDAHGHAEIRRGIGAFLDAFPDFEARVEPGSVVAEGDLVAMRVTLSGTHEGSFAGIEPTGKRMEIANTVFTRVEDGRVVERWLLPDMLGMLTQLGVVEPPFER